MDRVEDCQTAAERQEHQDTREEAPEVLGSVILTRVRELAKNKTTIS